MNYRARLLWVWMALLLLTGCGTLPPREGMQPSRAFSDTAHTALWRVAAASIEPGANQSGFRLLPNGDHAFDARLALIQRAERSLDVQYYHLHADSAGAAFVLALRDAAQRGVRVRLLVDDFHAGEVYALLRGLDAQPNVEVRIFNPMLARWGTPLKRMLLSMREFARVNHRMHNKLLVADNALAIFGGRNIADEYFSRHGEANFIDLDLISAGAIVPSLSASFDLYWNSEVVWPLEQRLHAWERSKDAADRQADFDGRAAALLGTAPGPVVTELDPLRQTSVRRQLAEGRLGLLAGRAQVHDDPPEKIRGPVVPNQPSAAMRGQLEVIGQAKQEVIIVNPYFLPGEIGMRMMSEATQRGVRGVIVTNSLGSTDEPLVHRAYSQYRAQMLRLGMHIYEFGPELVRLSGNFGSYGASTPRLHAKVTGVDRRWLLVGSVNLDGRSAILNTELTVVIDSPALVRQALSMLEHDAFASMYRLQLAKDGQTIEWHAKDAQGRATVELTEPHRSPWLDLSLWFQSLLVAEESL